MFPTLAVLSPTAVPLVLLCWTMWLRRRKGAPPLVSRVAFALGLAALVVSASWDLSTGLLGLFVPGDFRDAVTGHLPALIAVFAASSGLTALWLLAATGRYVWWARPVVVVGSPPYR